MEQEEQLSFDMWLPRQAHSALGNAARKLGHSTAVSRAWVDPSPGRKVTCEIGL